jgi:hypothetical protein
VFTLPVLIVIAVVAVVMFLVGVLTGRKSQTANYYADELYARAKAAEDKLAELKAEYRAKVKG